MITVKKALKFLTAWRGRRRLMRVAGWHDARERLLVAKAKHQRSAHHLKAMQAALHANMRGDG